MNNDTISDKSCFLFDYGYYSAIYGFVPFAFKTLRSLGKVFTATLQFILLFITYVFTNPIFMNCCFHCCCIVRKLRYILKISKRGFFIATVI